MTLFEIPHRIPSEEILDAGIPPEEAERSLRDIEWAHRNLGGRRLMKKTFLPFLLSLPAARLELLDLGCGSGHVSLDLEARLASAGKSGRVHGLDRAAAHVRLGRRGTSLCGDAFRLPFADQSLDVVFSALFVHHFSPDELARLVSEMARVARLGVAAFDVSRTYLALGLVSVVGPLVFQSPVTVWDAKASVRQAYTLEELESVLSPLLPGVQVEPSGLLAISAIWRRPSV